MGHNSLNIMSLVDLRCSRCHGAGHCAKDCHLPFLRTKTVQEERQDRLHKRTAVLTKKGVLTKGDWQQDRSLGQQLRTLRDVEREARKEKLAKERQREREQKEGLWLKTLNGHDREIDWECSSQSTACTARTPLTLTPDDEEAMRCKVEADKDVRRLQKKLRDIIKLESCDKLDELQQAKLDKKFEVQVELDTARGLARARAKNELQLQG